MTNCNSFVSRFIIYLGLSVVCGVGVLMIGGRYVEAQTAATTSNDGAAAESVPTVEETVNADAGLSPDSRLYFFDRIGEWAHLHLFTFGAEKKAELKARFAEERLAELKHVVENKLSQNIVEKTKARLERQLNDVENDAERMDAGGKDASRLVEKLNSLTVRHQGVLERLLERAPEQARPAIEHVLKVSRAGHKRAEKILLRQKEKGNISKERAQLILQKNIERLRGHINASLKRVEALPKNDPKRERLNGLIEHRVEYLEERLLDEGSNESLKDFSEKLRDEQKRAARHAIKIRRLIKRHATSTEEALGRIQEGSFNREDFARRVEHAIEKAREAVKESRVVFERARAAGVRIPESVKRILENAAAHLDSAVVALQEKHLGEALGLAISAERGAENARRVLKHAVNRLEEMKGNTEKDLEKSGEETGNETEKVLQGGEEENGARGLRNKRINLHGKAINRVRTDARKRNGAVDGLKNVQPRTLRNQEKKEVRVEIRDGSFVPSHVAIRAGDTVVWTNKSGHRSWPASAVHPTHQQYPGFDALRGLETGDDYSFTFKRPGTWKYHDHLHPSVVGTVTVEE